MPILNASTNLVADGNVPGSPARRTPPPARGRRYTVEGLVITLLMPPLLLASLAATTWSFWILASGVLGRQGTILAVVASVASVAAFSRSTGRGFAVSLILVGFGCLVVLIGALFGVAGYRLIHGG